MALGSGVQTAQMNRPKSELEKIEELVENGIQPPLDELLFLDARSAVDRKAFTLAVVESFQALEIMLENFLTDAFKRKGVAQSEYEKTLDSYWKTKERLTTVLQQAVNRSLNTDTSLWDKWCTIYDKVRNEVIHQGRQVSEVETRKVLDINEEVVRWLKKS